MGVPTVNIYNMIKESANKYGVPFDIALAVANKESGFNPNAVGSSGEIGLYQLMPGTANDLGISDKWDIGQNIDGGIRYLSQLYSRFGDWPTALMAYNGGMGNVERGTVSSAARKYAADVLNKAGDVWVKVTEALGFGSGNENESVNPNIPNAPINYTGYSYPGETIDYSQYNVDMISDSVSGVGGKEIALGLAVGALGVWLVSR